MKTTGVILAGGKSRRMGQNKSLLKMGDKTIIEIIVDKLSSIFDELILVTNTKDDYKMLKNIRIVPDAYISNEANSLIGLYTGILEAKNDYIFVMACDMPFIDTRLIEYMINHIEGNDIVVPYLNGFYQSLHAIYKKSTLEFIKSLYVSGDYKISRLYEDFPQLTIKKIEKTAIDTLKVSEDCFLNLNTPKDYKKAKVSYINGVIV